MWVIHTFNSRILYKLILLSLSPVTHIVFLPIFTGYQIYQITNSKSRPPITANGILVNNNYCHRVQIII